MIIHPFDTTQLSIRDIWQSGQTYTVKIAWDVLEGFSELDLVLISYAVWIATIHFFSVEHHLWKLIFKFVFSE